MLLPQTGSRDDLGRAVLRAVAAGLCVAAGAAILSILTGDFSDGDLKVIGTSVLVAVASATGGAGLNLRLRATHGAVVLGSTVAAASALSFVLVTYGMWAEVDAAGFWHVTGAAAIVALDGSHACFVLARARPTDPESATVAMRVAVTAAAVSGTLGLLAVSGLAEDGPWQLLAVVLVVQLLATALAPLARRTAAPRASPPPAAAFGRHERDLGVELLAIADALEQAASPAEVHDQARRLRVLARRARG